jgi:hypothetical protein
MLYHRLGIICNIPPHPHHVDPAKQHGRMNLMLQHMEAMNQQVHWSISHPGPRLNLHLVSAYNIFHPLADFDDHAKQDAKLSRILLS